MAIEGGDNVNLRFPLWFPATESMDYEIESIFSSTCSSYMALCRLYIERVEQDTYMSGWVRFIRREFKVTKRRWDRMAHMDRV